MSEAVFRTVNQALHVSHMIASLPPTSKSNTQTVIEQLMRDAGVMREVERDGTLNFAGLSPLEVRGQCATVRGAVLHHCTEAERMAIWAWFAHDQTKAEGVRYLRDWCAPRFSLEGDHVRMLITWRASVTDDSAAARHCSIRDIAGEHGLAKSTVQRNIANISKACKGLRNRGAWRLEEMFIAHGLVDNPEVEEIA
ncbi:MAG: hypothetical protein KGL90_15520 [Burkholderiales bacterium]|nr:hypothetical protein [Burkholderiales bacterium]